MIPLSLAAPQQTSAFYILLRGYRRREWQGHDDFMDLIHLILYRGGQAQTDMIIFCVATGKSVYSGVAQQKALNKARRTGGYQIARQQFGQLALMLGLEWESIWAAYIEAHLKKKFLPSWQFMSEWKLLHGITSEG